MKHGKHDASRTVFCETNGRRSRRLKWKKSFVFLIAVIVLLMGTVGGSLAYLVASGGTATNTFQYDTVSCNITETMSNNVKSDVKVQNTGSTPAYIRAAVIVTWKDSDGNVAPVVPVAGTDYSISFEKNGWTLGSDGYYYYPTAVASGNSTTNLIKTCSPLTAGPEGYTLSVEILADAIQSSPAVAVSEAWGVTVAEDGRITK